jgi:flagellar motor switch protein FliM
MPDVMTQSEIDRLLSALSSTELDADAQVSEAPGKVIRTYDFKRPNKFAKDQLRTLEMMYENYARLISTFLSGYLRSFATVEVISVEQLTYQEFSSSISNPSFMVLFGMAPLEGHAILEIGCSTFYAIIDRLLGGDGHGDFDTRSFTEIELTIMNNTAEKMLRYMAEPWKNVADITPRVERIETNTQFIQFMPPNETIALITMKVKIGNTEGMINLCLPYLTLETVSSKLSTRHWFTFNSNRFSDKDAQVLEKRLETASVTVKVILGRCRITVEEFNGLQRGDVLVLDSKCSEPLSMCIGDSAIYSVKPGVRNKRLAAKILDIATKGDMADE